MTKIKIIKKGAKEALQAHSVSCCLNVPVVIYPEGQRSQQNKEKTAKKLE